MNDYYKSKLRKMKDFDEKIYDKSLVIVIKPGNKTLKCNEFVMGEDNLQ